MAFLFSDIARRFSGSNTWDRSVGNRTLYFKSFIICIYYIKEVIILALMNRSTPHTCIITYEIFLSASVREVRWLHFFNKWHIGDTAKVALKCSNRNAEVLFATASDAINVMVSV